MFKFIKADGELAATGLKEKVRDFLKNIKNKMGGHLFWAASSIFGAYVAASAVSSLFIPLLTESLGKINLTPAVSVASEVVTTQGRPNFHELRKVILDRNLFNLKGEVPTENEEGEGEGGGSKKEHFNADAPCSPPTLNATLVGTIYLGASGSSLAILKETGYDEVDIYKEGDVVINNEQAQIVSIGRNHVVINHGGTKECLEIKLGLEGRGLEAMASMPAAAKPLAAATEGGVETVVLAASFVGQELGDGFEKLIQAARLVPNTENNQVNGFKIFAIQKESLLDKVGLHNGDIITQVNDTVMDAEHGFALYQAFNEEKEIVIRVLRNGSTPHTLQVRIQ